MSEIAGYVISGVIAASTALYVTYAMKKTMKKTEETLKKYINSEEFIEKIGEIGDIFGQGLMTAIKDGTKGLGKGSGTVNILGMKLPAEIVYGIAQKYLKIGESESHIVSDERFK